MSNPNPKNQFKAGNKAAKKEDSEKLTEITRQIKAITKEEIIKLISKYIKTPYKEIKQMLQNESGISGELMIASIINKVITTGNMDALQKLLDRSIGKVTDHVAIDANVTQNHSDEQLCILANDAIKILANKDSI